jgi:hypothetical protein
MVSSEDKEEFWDRAAYVNLSREDISRAITAKQEATARVIYFLRTLNLQP